MKISWWFNCFRLCFDVTLFVLFVVFLVQSANKTNQIKELRQELKGVVFIDDSLVPLLERTVDRKDKQIKEMELHIEDLKGCMQNLMGRFDKCSFEE